MPTVTDLDAQRASVWDRLLAIDEEFATLERLEKAGLQALGTRTQVLVDRLKRQRKRGERACAHQTHQVFLQHRPEENGDEREWSVTTDQLEAYQKYLADYAANWTLEVVDGFDAEILDAIQSDLLTLPEVPSATPPPNHDATIHGRAPVKPVMLPSTFEIILKFWGTHKDLSLWPAASMGLVYFAIAAPWAEQIQKMLATAAAAITLFPLVWLGSKVADKERRKLVRDARDAHDAALIAFAKEEVGDALHEHEEALARWIQARAEAWRQTLIAHNDATFYEIHKKHFRDQRRALLLEKKCLEERSRELASAKR